MSLYELTEDAKNIDELLEAITEELNSDAENEKIIEREEQARQLRECIQALIEEKSSNIVKVIRDYDTDIEKLDAEIKRMQALKKHKQKKIDALKLYTQECMERLGTKKINTYLGDIKIRKGTGVIEFIDESLIPQKYKTIVTETKIDKNAIKKDIKSGEIVDGAMLVIRDSLIIPKSPKVDK